MKRAVLTIAAGDAKYHAVTLPRLASFAHHVGADFHAITRLKVESEPAIRTVGDRFYTDRRRSYAWMKLSELEPLIPLYDRILVLDSDIIPNFGIKIDWETLFTGPSKLALDHGHGKMDDIFVDWCERRMPKAPIEMGMPYYNSGVLCLTQADAAHLLRRWYALKPVPVERYNDQDFINWLIVADRIQIETLPVEYNWMHPYEAETKARAGLIHFAGSEVKALMAEYDCILPHRP